MVILNDPIAFSVNVVKLPNVLQWMHACLCQCVKKLLASQGFISQRHNEFIWLWAIPSMLSLSFFSEKSPLPKSPEKHHLHQISRHDWCWKWVTLKSTELFTLPVGAISWGAIMTRRQKWLLCPFLSPQAALRYHKGNSQTGVSETCCDNRYVMPVWRSQTTSVLRLPPELLRMRTVKDIKVNAFVFVYRSHTYPPRLRWEHLSVHRTLFGFILWNENISNASSLITRVRSD